MNIDTSDFDAESGMSCSGLCQGFILSYQGTRYVSVTVGSQHLPRARRTLVGVRMGRWDTTMVVHARFLFCRGSRSRSC